jgi:AraC-like DNA-binding protein
MTPIAYLAVGAALSQLVLTAMLLMAGHLNNLSRSLFGLLIFAAICYLLVPLTDHWQGHWLLVAGSTLVPGAFWLFCASVFDDHYEFPWWQPCLVALSVALPTVFNLWIAKPGSWWETILVDFPQILEFVFLAMALYAIFNNWRDDLVASRRVLRLWFCGGLGLTILLIILAREVLFAGAAWLITAQYGITAVVGMGINLLLLRLQPGELDPISRQQAVAVTMPAAATDSLPVAGPNPTEAWPEGHDGLVVEASKEWTAELTAVTHRVESKALYREWGLTIGKLAAEMDIPEHRLRRLINSGLGYRNFNDFLNQYRIEEAAQRLADPKQARIPVLTIALEAGFRSLSTFNKAFKDIHRQTPTSFRKHSVEQKVA